MQEVVGEDQCPIFKASISLDLADQGRIFKWGVALDWPQGSDFWGIPTEVQDVNSVERYRQFRFNRGEGAPQKEVFKSDAALYGGQNVGNGGGVIPSNQSRLNVVIPANGFVVFVKQ